MGGGSPLRAPPVRGELFALLMPLGFALLASELEGVGCSSNAERLALFGIGTTPFASE